MSSTRVCAIVGVGPGNGAAFARHFAAKDYRLSLMARSPGFITDLARELPNARAYPCDVADDASVSRAFEATQRELGDVDVLIYNAGSGNWGTIDQVTAEAFENDWRVNALGGLLASRAVLPAMKRAQHGNIVFIGATASLRGGAKTVAFASAKAAQRSLAQSMARELWPQGIHVSLIIIDGVIDLPRTRKAMPDKPDEFFLKPADIAETVSFVTEQPRSAWSFEVEARPFGERW